MWINDFSFGSLMNIDKLILFVVIPRPACSFGSLMNIDKLIHYFAGYVPDACFGSLMNIDKLIQKRHSSIVNCSQKSLRKLMISSG